MDDEKLKLVDEYQLDCFATSRSFHLGVVGQSGFSILPEWIPGSQLRVTKTDEDEGWVVDCDRLRT